MENDVLLVGGTAGHHVYILRYQKGRWIEEAAFVREVNKSEKVRIVEPLSQQIQPHRTMLGCA